RGCAPGRRSLPSGLARRIRRGSRSASGPQVALTRGCTTTGVSGVPVGAHTATPLCTSTGTPPASTRAAPMTHWAVTQGPPEAGGNGQPATAYGDDRVVIGWPDTSTRGKGARGVACPACAQMTVAPRWRMKPGIALPQVIVRAPLLMSTAAPAAQICLAPVRVLNAAAALIFRGLVVGGPGPAQTLLN